MNVPRNTSTPPHEVQQTSYRGQAFSPTSRMNRRLDYHSWSSGETLHPTPVAPLNLHISDSNHFALASHSARLCPPSVWPLAASSRLHSRSTFLPFFQFSFLFLRRWPPCATSCLKVHRKHSQIDSSRHGKEAHLHTQARLTDVCKQSRSGSGVVLKTWKGGEFHVSPKCELAAWKTWSILFYCELLKTASYCIWDWNGLEPPVYSAAAGTQLYNSYSQLFFSHPAYCCLPKGSKASSTDKAHSHLKWSVR